VNALRNEITQVLQLDCQIDVVHDNIVWNLQDDGREVQDRLDARFDKRIRDGLSPTPGDGQNGKLHAVFREKQFLLIHGQNRDFQMPVFRAFRAIIERSDNLEPFFGKPIVMDQGGSQVSGADENDRLKPGGAKHTRKLSLKGRYLISKSPRPKLAEVSEIFSKLGRLHPGRLCQSRGRNRINSILEESLNDSEIQRESVDGFPRDHKLRHK
jgi:hypothetical protein